MSNENQIDNHSAEFIPLTEISLISTDGRSVGATIKENGDLIVSGLDWGSGPNSSFGGDYEYSITIPAHLKDSFLLLLLAHRFEDFPQLRDWLQEKGIPFANWAWSG